MTDYPRKRLTVWGVSTADAPVSHLFPSDSWQYWADEWICDHNASVGFPDWELRSKVEERMKDGNKYYVTLCAVFGIGGQDS